MSINESAQKKPIEQASEVELYFIIDCAGYMMWRLNHDAADGRIPNAGVDESIKSIHDTQQEAVNQLTRFGISPFLEDGKSPSKAYWDWYYRWDKYIKNLSPKEYTEIEDQINNGDPSKIKVK